MAMVQGTLVLFDIDGTLVDVHGAGRRAFARGLANAYGVIDDLAHVRFAGATDKGVLAALRDRHALPVEREAAFFDAMALALADELAREAASACPGAIALVEALGGAADVRLGLVTGNTRATARAKLRAVDLEGVFEAHAFVGGFGDEHHDRRALARLAVERAGPAARVVLIGDTSSDVDAALAVGAVAIAVNGARGDVARAGLTDAGAHLVVDTLADPAVWSLIAS